MTSFTDRRAEQIAAEIAADPARLRALQDLLDDDAAWLVHSVYWRGIVLLIDRSVVFLSDDEGPFNRPCA